MKCDELEYGRIDHMNPANSESIRRLLYEAYTVEARFSAVSGFPPPDMT